jgi:hypothetical protein
MLTVGGVLSVLPTGVALAVAPGLVFPALSVAQRR